MVLYYDMDAFFASIEIRDNPKLKNLPIAIGHGVISSCNYIARKYGVKSAMSLQEAKKKCKDVVIISSRTAYYFSVGEKIQKYIKEKYLNPHFVSCDEGFINIPEDIKNFKKFAEEFKKNIEKEFNLPLSIGVGINRLMAKMASEVNKPNGMYFFLTKDEFLNYTIDKSLKIFPGIGKKTYEILNLLGIKTTRDLLYKSREDLCDIFGNSRANQMYDLIRGNESEKAKSDNISISKEHTFVPSLTNKGELEIEIIKITEELIEEIIEKNLYPKTLTLKIRFSSFRTITKSKTYINTSIDKENIYDFIIRLIEEIDIKEDIRLFGISLSNFEKDKIEYLTLF